MCFTNSESWRSRSMAARAAAALAPSLESPVASRWGPSHSHSVNSDLAIVREALEESMGFRNITKGEFELILSELTYVFCEIRLGETFIIHHVRYGAVTLVRDGSGYMALAWKMTYLDDFLAGQGSLASGGS